MAERGPAYGATDEPSSSNTLAPSSSTSTPQPIPTFPTGFYETWPACCTTFPKAFVTLNQTSEFPISDRASFQLLLRVVRYLVLTTQYPLAKQLVTRLYDAALRLQPEADKDRLAATSLSVRYLLAFEEGKRAEAQIRPAYEAAERAYGSRSIHVFQCEYWPAYAPYRQGKGAEGMAMLERAVTRAREYLPPDHSFLLRAQCLLARLFLLAGRSQASWTLLEAVVNAQTRTLPPGHPALMEARQDYSFALSLQGKVEGGLTLARATLDDCKKYLSTEHVLHARRHSFMLT